MTYFNVILGQKIFFEPIPDRSMTYTSKQYQIVLEYKENFCFKCTLDMTYTSNGISKKKFFGHHYKHFKKTHKNLAIKTPPQVNKKGKRLFSQFNNCLT